jgi:hypothetical protein
MSLGQIGNEQWDFVDAEGSETRLPATEATGPPVDFPARWRFFGPLKSKVGVFPPQTVTDMGVGDLIESLTCLPDKLKIDGESYVGQDVDSAGDTFNMDVLESEMNLRTDDLFERHAIESLQARVGRQVYAFAELDLDEETEVPFGAGAGFWMQWWIDGKAVYDTLVGGNLTHPPNRSDHSFRCRLSAGRHLLAVRLISGQGSWVFKTGVLCPREETLSRITMCDRWQFLPDLDEIRPPYRKGTIGQHSLDWGHTMAIAADRCLAEETIECEFQMSGEANFGIILGAQDSGHYYTLQIPRWGQLWRARTFWACLCKADGSGYLRNLKMMLIPHVVCHWNVWIHLKVQRRGNCIRTWIDGVNGPSVTDDTYGPGRVGLTGFTKYTVRHLKIDGKAVDGPAWKAGDFRGQPWFLPAPSEGSTVSQSSSELLHLSDDEILMVMHEHRPDSTRPETKRMLLSHDNGCTWAPRKPQDIRDVPMCAPWGLRWFVPRPGVIRAFEIGEELKSFQYHPLPHGAVLSWRESEDKGQTWTEPKPCKLLGDWSRDIFREETWNHIVGGIRLKDGTLLALILHGYPNLQKMIPHRGQGTWGSECAQPYISRSEDDGLTWSEPVPMDNAAINDGAIPDGPHGGFSETVFAQLPSGRIVAHCRPFAAPFMWRTHSDDGGRTWRLVTYEPFSGSGGPQLLCTQSGYLVSVKRGPALCLHISTDGGMNWDEGTIIDYPASFNGHILEVEPDVVLVLYPESMGEFRPSYVRAQRLRITPEGPVPVAP